MDGRVRGGVDAQARSRAAITAREVDEGVVAVVEVFRAAANEPERTLKALRELREWAADLETRLRGQARTVTT